MSQKSGFTVNHAPDRATLERQSALAIADSLRSLLARQQTVRAVFAAAASQLGTLALLRQQDGIDWHRVEAFHMDEYVGLPIEHPARFGNWLKRNVFDHLPLGAVHLIEPGADAQAAAQNYAAQLAAAPIDLVCLGIGVNGHIAFNDPPVADFNDPLTVKVVELDLVCRQQQVDDGEFATTADVPRHAITLTIPQLMAGKRLICIVPGASKAAAVRGTIHGPIDTACPASILRRHDDCTLYVDQESYPQ
ncbi:glucosamine-6-phosphate deaminase [Devosia ginsengisoli]|uniref:glucosamine-6-phosphate deaminase n=1 Tax=Devosia ginsengisoli TaxID=400770 RepID=UPI0026F1C197|nr:glucosamine-6-phosphate deaminase [Devosia ginsengisoli]MCR6673565.1 glucosamine-6-phosphate deaminase [Devosia ginsengisoli]